MRETLWSLAVLASCSLSAACNHHGAAPAAGTAGTDGGPPAHGDGDGAASTRADAADASHADGQTGSGDARPETTPDASAVESEILAYCTDLATAECQYERDCSFEVAPGPAEDACLTAREGSCRDEATSLLIPDVVAGRTTFDRVGAAIFLSALDAAGCSLTAAANSNPFSFFTGRLADGAPCVDARECRGARCDRSHSCPGTCASPAPVGGACDPFGCDATTGGCGADGKCAAPIAIGAACGTARTGACGALAFCGGTGFMCDPSAGKSCLCVAYPSAGEPCSEVATCPAGLDCVQGFCRNPGTKGDPCGEDDGTCLAGLVCLLDDFSIGPPSGHCADPVREDGTCFGGDCARGLACVHGTDAAPYPTPGVCHPPAGLGEPCHTDKPCAGGATCGADRTCVSPSAKLGDSCAAYLAPDPDVAPNDPCTALMNQCRVIFPGCVGAGVECSNTNVGTCIATPVVGQPCTNDCAAGAFCPRSPNGAICTPLKGTGEACSFDDYECQSGVCSRGVCASPCSVANL